MLFRLSAIPLLAALCTPAASADTPTFDRDDYASYAGARGIATADFDRNGWPDLAQANTGRNTVAVVLNHVNGIPGFRSI
jgi:hypothetical protein